MDILIQPTSSRSAVTSNDSFSKAKPSVSFNELVAKYAGEVTAGQANKPGAGQPLLVGEITRQNQTVSELLMQHKDLHASTWDIIQSEQNVGKDYTKIRPGTRIYYNPTDGSLTWSNGKHNSVSASQPAPLPRLHPAQLHQPSEANGQGSASAAQLELGKISEKFPTVSHLLQAHPTFRDQTWNLIASEVNRDKPFHTIPSGTAIFLDEKNMEITWNRSNPPSVADHPKFIAPETAAQTTPIAPQPSRQAADLSEAVQQYLGTSYDKIDCYELIVKGLGQMNIPYSGKNGLYSELTKLARTRGLAPNAYLNGEGIVEAAGSLVLSKKYSGQGSWQAEAESLIREIEPLLDNGQILSFSTRKRGHTGIVSQQNNQWTFINSGRLDNSVANIGVYKGVGEEVLQDEIRNWFKLAHRNNERLSVTLGRLEQEKIRTTLNMPETSLKRT